MGTSFFVWSSASAERDIRGRREEEQKEEKERSTVETLQPKHEDEKGRV
jgi:hypothetical protein